MEQTIFDNSAGKELLRVIQGTLPESKEAKFAVGYFFLSGFELVEENFPNDPRFVLKIIMGRDTTRRTGEELISGHDLREQFKQDLLLDLAGELSETGKANIGRLAEWIGKKRIEVRLFETDRLHAKLYLFLTQPGKKFESQGVALVGSSNFTSPGLQTNRELNVLLTEKTQIDYLNGWYDRLWGEAREFAPDLLKIIDISGLRKAGERYPPLGEPMAPERLFRYLVWRWFDGRVARLSQKDVLSEYQLVGVVNVMRMLDFHNGAIVADSVGLGKSFLGMAIVEDYIEGRLPHWRTDKERVRQALLLLPPSLINQWEEILLGDMDEASRESYVAGGEVECRSYFFIGRMIRRREGAKENDKTLEIIDVRGALLGRLRLYSLGLFQGERESPDDLADGHDLILVDEAHRYRNQASRRWERLRRLRSKSDGTTNRMLLLTATPVNNSVYDLYNLVRLFCDDTFYTFRMAGKGDVPALFKEYARLFQENREKPDGKKAAALSRKAGELQRKVVDEVVLLRTRKHVRESFPDLEIGGRKLIFKDPRPFPLDYKDFASARYREFLKTATRVLPELNFEHTKLYGAQVVGFSEQSFSKDKKRVYVALADIFRLLLGKRLESGLYAFEVTFGRLYAKERLFYQEFVVGLDEVEGEEDLRAHLERCIESAGVKRAEEVDEEFEESDGDWFGVVLGALRAYGDDLGERLQVAKGRLETDLKLLGEVLDALDAFKRRDAEGRRENPARRAGGSDTGGRTVFRYENDPKWEALKSLLGPPERMSESLKGLPNLHGRKVVIFTQYKDTAYYLYRHLCLWAREDARMHALLLGAPGSSEERLRVGLVTGDTDAVLRAKIKRRFAPEANRGHNEARLSGDLQLLVTTDAFAEGVNLQDAHAVVNFDLPWNPMVLVQRVGRINRIGNEKEVLVVNFYPLEEIRPLVGVLRKLQDKIHDMTLLVGKESRILEPGETVDEKTFGERIRRLAGESATDLEQEALPAELRGMVSERDRLHADEFRLLQEVQFVRGYRPGDFVEFEGIERKPRFCFLRGADRLVSIYELSRGKKGEERTIERRVVSVSLGDGADIREESPLALLRLLDLKEGRSTKVLEIADALKVLGEASLKREQDLRDDTVVLQRGFLRSLSEKLKLEHKARWGGDAQMNEVFGGVYNALGALSPQRYTSELKPLLVDPGFLEEKGRNIAILDPDRVLLALAAHFKERKIGGADYTAETTHYGWFYEG